MIFSMGWREADRFAHELLAIREGQDPVLWEGDEAQVDDIAHLIAELEQGPQGREGRIADVDVRPDDAGPLRDFPEDGLARPGLHVLVGQRRLPVGPGQDALDERAGFVMARLTDRERGIHVDVRVDERRRQEAAIGLELDRLRASRGGQLPRRADGRDPVALDEDIDRIGARPQCRMNACAPDDQPHTGPTTTSLANDDGWTTARRPSTHAGSGASVGPGELGRQGPGVAWEGARTGRLEAPYWCR